MDIIQNTAKNYFNIDYVFPYQRLVISNILRASGYYQEDIGDVLTKQLVLLPTGAGKSLCFMLPGILLDGLTIIIFPLLSLMADQERRIIEAGSSAVTIRGGLSREKWDEISTQVENNTIKFIITNPESLKTEKVQKILMKSKISHIVIDESHTLTEWGEQFRPSYLELGDVLLTLNCNLLTAFTATASDRIVEGLVRHLFRNDSFNIVRGNPDRENIHYSVIPSISKKETLLEVLKTAQYPIIIFHSSRLGTQMINNFLISSLKRDDIVYYHAGLLKTEKDEIEKWFFTSKTGILNATCAYGMGVDKSNIRTVIHYDIPTTVEAYLQESGRGGRDRAPAKAIIIKDARDRDNPVSKVLEANNCRRESLLSLLNARIDYCSGCDICDKANVATPTGELQIIEYLKKNNLRKTLKDSAYILKGYHGYGNSQEYGFGILYKWDLDSIKEGIIQLILKGKIKKAKNIFYKNFLYFSSKQDITNRR